MIRTTWRRVVRFLGSAGLAMWLLLFLGAWSVAATLIPQGAAADPKVMSWAAEFSFLEPVVRTIGLHQAFTSLAFMTAIIALGLSTGLCAWQRTKVAMGKSRSLRRAADMDETSLIETHDLDIPCDPALETTAVLAIAAETLERLGIRTKRRGNVLGAVSAPWSVWGSPVFHWALFALIAVLLVGNLQRSEGLMGVTVGQTKADEPASYGVINAGPWHDWSRVQRSIRIDSFEPNYRFGGIDRGPTPTVSVLDGTGRVVKTQRVYPNMPLQTGSLTIHSAEYGFSVTVVILNAAGVETGRSVKLIDFSDTAADGTAMVGTLVIRDSAGAPELDLSLSIPTGGTPGQTLRVIPDEPTVRVVGIGPDGATKLDSVVPPNEDLALPIGGSLRIVDVGFYTRLSVVDDSSIPLLYAGLVAAMIGLTITVMARQQIVLAAVQENGSGSTLAISMRLWRNAPTNRSEIESELSEALGEVEKEIHTVIVETVLMWIALACYAVATAMFGFGVTFFKDALIRRGLIAATIGLAAQVASLGVRWVRVGHGPYLGFYEVASALVLCAVGFFVVAAWRNPRLSAAGIGIMPVALLLLGGSMLASTDVVPINAKFDSAWLFVHVAFANLAFGAFAVSFGGALVYVIRQRSADGRWAKRLEKLPVQDVLENLTVRFVLVGFLFWGIMIATGAIWANEAWGRYWGWDPIETWSLIVWIIYAVYLHLRFTLKWGGERLAWFAIVAMPLALFALIGIPFAFNAPHAGIGGLGKDGLTP